MTMTHNLKKVFILGVDGGTFDVIDPLINKGMLPNFEKIINSGVKSKLRSTIPPQSSAAWPSMITGKNPGKTGIFSFWEYKKGSLERPIISSRSVKTFTLWDILTKFKKNYIAINVPVSYPPVPGSGQIIGCLLTPDVECNFTYPPELHTELLSQIGEIKLEAELEKKVKANASDIELLEAVYELVEIRRNIMHYLLKNRSWDVFMIVFTFIDRLQHFFWKYHCPQDFPEVDKNKLLKLRGVINQAYIRMDKILGEILSMLDSSTSLIVMSDHGFGSKKKNVYLNFWLNQNGLLIFKKPLKLRRLRIVNTHPKISKIFSKLLPNKITQIIPPKFGQIKIPFPKLVRIPHLYMINWKKTKVYANWIGSEEGFFLNLKGREPFGCVEPGDKYDELREEIIEKMKQLKDEEDGNPIFDKIWKKEDIYKGKYLDIAPDIIFKMRGHSYMPAPGFDSGKIFIKTSEIRRNYTLEAESGQHRPEGILIMRGDLIKKGVEIQGANILDVLPTLLYLLNIPGSSDMDGVVLKDAIASKLLEIRKPEIDDSIYEGLKKQFSIEKEISLTGYSKEDEEKVKEHLRGLGYVG